MHNAGRFVHKGSTGSAARVVDKQAGNVQEQSARTYTVYLLKLQARQCDCGTVATGWHAWKILCRVCISAGTIQVRRRT